MQTFGFDDHARPLRRDATEVPAVVPCLAGVLKAKEVVSNDALNISEIFGTSSSGDSRLSACIARVYGDAIRQAAQTPESDEYIMVISGEVTMVRASGKGAVREGEGVLLRAGELIQWIFDQPCVYVIVCLPSEDTGAMPGHPHGLLPAPPAVDLSSKLAFPPPISASSPLSSKGSKGSRGSRSTSDPSLPMEMLFQNPELHIKEASDSAAEQLLPEVSAQLQPARSKPSPSAMTEDLWRPPTPESPECTEGTVARPVTPSRYNIPEYIPACGDMARATSLSIFDQILDNDGLLALRALREKLEDQADARPARYAARHLDTPIVVVSSEINPWSKTGGLAMVAGSLAYEFAVRGHRTMAVSPHYEDYKNCERIGSAKIWLNGQDHEVQYFHQRQEYGNGRGCDYIFVEHSCFHRSAGLYGDPAQGGEYEDNLFRFALLTIAATEAPLVLNIGGSIYGQDVCFVANDWQTGLLPVYLLYKYKRNGTYQKARSMMVLHNLGYQGKYRKSTFPCDRFLGLPCIAESFLQGEDMHYGEDCINLLGAGIQLADRVLTVSPNYAIEIQTPEGGHGLHSVIKEKSASWRVAGILNGISDEWNPVTDPHIPKNFGPSDFAEGKKICKAALQRELGLHEDPNVALIGFCGRLCFQKGVHLITKIIPWLMADQGNGVNGQVQLILMGKGNKSYEEQLRQAEASLKGRVCGYVGFDPTIEHRMMAACDLLLMPSQYEPCGLPQMYAQAYATLPVVHQTGGLKDSVFGLWDEERDRSTATGFLFCGFDCDPLMEKLYQAIHTFHHKKPVFRDMQMNAINGNYHWSKAIDEYEQHVDFTMEDPPHCQ